jgi:hypothetical protein
VEALFATDALVVDACRHVVRCGGETISLATRPILFALLRTLAEACPGDASRATLLLRAFRARHADESHRARLRVEMGRLRAELASFASIEATKGALCRWRCLVQLGAGDRARHQQPHGAARAGAAFRARQGAIDRPRSDAALADADSRR